MATACTPDFMVVGAMKAGTTTLYRDLLRHPRVFLPTNKEPEVLVHFPTAATATAEYAELFKRAGAGQKKGEASTAYTKRPTYEGVAELAREVCGAIRIIYLRRDPIERMISHYKHFLQHGLISGSFAEVVARDDTLVDYSRYDWQIAPWIEVFGADAVLQLDLDDYSRNRRKTLERVIAHIGLDPASTHDVDVQVVANRAEEAKTISNPVLDRIVASGLYQKRLKPLIPAHAREKLRHLVLPEVASPEIDIPEETLAYIRDKLSQCP